MKLNSAVENIIALAEVASDQIITSVSNASKSAGKAIDFEITIKKLNSLKNDRVRNLGEYALKNNEVNKDILKEINDIENKINQLKAEREEYIAKENK